VLKKHIQMVTANLSAERIGSKKEGGRVDWGSPAREKRGTENVGKGTCPAHNSSPKSGKRKKQKRGAFKSQTRTTGAGSKGGLPNWKKKIRKNNCRAGSEPQSSPGEGGKGTKTGKKKSSGKKRKRLKRRQQQGNRIHKAQSLTN